MEKHGCPTLVVRFRSMLMAVVGVTNRFVTHLISGDPDSLNV